MWVMVQGCKTLVLHEATSRQGLLDEEELTYEALLALLTLGRAHLRSWCFTLPTLMAYCHSHAGNCLE